MFVILKKAATLAPFLLIPLALSCQLGKDQASKVLSEPASSLYDPALKPFYHGVASGDPSPEGVILWTRVTPSDSVPAIEVAWQVSGQASFGDIVREGSVTTTPARDYTVKVDVSGLSPGTTYYYRFTALETTSPVGKTRTLPSGTPDSLRFAVVSCSNWQAGYFNAYDRVAEKDVDAVIHLGDYIYEYGAERARNGLDRTHLPAHEIVTLQDYRTRYAQYHLDAGLRNLRQQHPVIAIWDDHEVANNSYQAGAQNHQPEKEGDFKARKAAARKAYYEWIPIREDEKHYRAFEFGSLADLIMLDERLEGRTVPAAAVDDPGYEDEGRSMLGQVQLSWLQARLENQESTWKIIGNQVIFSDVDRSAIFPSNPRNMDSWDGYPSEKRKIADFIRKRDIGNIIFLTGDTHSSWAFEVNVQPRPGQRAEHAARPLGVELGTPSITSGNGNESTSDDTVRMREQLYLKTNQHLRYTNQRDHGYIILTLYRDKAKAQWYYVDTLLQPDRGEKLSKTFMISSGKLH